MASSASMPFLHMLMFVTLTATVCFLSVRLFRTVRDVEKLQRRVEVMTALPPPMEVPAPPAVVVENDAKKPILVEVELPETLEPIAEEIQEEAAAA